MLEFANRLQATGFSTWLQATGWVIPFLQSVHIVMIGVVFVSILVVSLRALGRIAMDQSTTDVLNRFSPWAAGGLIVMALTGVLLVIAEPVRQFSATSFWLKMALIAFGVLVALGFRAALRRAPAPGGQAAARRERIMALCTIVLWLCVIFLGRAIAYDIEIWGPMSLNQRFS